MKTVTLKRKWSIIESASRIKLFVQCDKKDATAEIKEVPCKMVCLVKNGKTLTLSVTEEETAIFLVSSSMTAAFTIPAGSNDVALLATPKYDISRGNPFKITKL